MKVRELIKELLELDMELDVMIHSYNDEATALLEEVDIQILDDPNTWFSCKGVGLDEICISGGISNEIITLVGK